MISTQGSNRAAAKRASVPLVLAMILAALGAAAVASADRRPGARRPGPALHSTRGRLAASGGVALFNREAYAFSSSLSLAQEARRYSILVLQAPYGSLVHLLHRYNPRLQVYMYQFIMYARADDPHGLELCTSLPNAVAHNWFLRGVGAQPLRAGAAYGIDPGIRSFQRSCAAHAAALAKRFGFDGVFLDGVGAIPGYQFGGQPIIVPKYPTERSWMGAMTSFLRTVTGVAHARGLRVIANIGGPQAWSAWAPLVDGAEEESWTDGGLGLAQQASWWKLKLDNAAWSEAHGKYVLLHSHNSGEAANVYGLASMLLIAAGDSSYSTSNTNYVGDETWFPEYGTARSLGPPLGHYRRLRGGVYERKFANGLVLVNPTLHSVARVPLHGTYSGSGLSHVSAAGLGPTSGLIVLRG